ncbi:MAG: hypothetical protein ACE5KM_02810 [Planctomycetaceae bacterium]
MPSVRGIADMRLLLCHECLFWVTPQRGRCPECDHTLDSGVADPSTDALDRLIGPAVGPIGCVRLKREMLPDRGTLYETANGLYFVPHTMMRRVELVERTQTGRSLLWMLAAIAFAPLILVLPFLRFKRLAAEEVAVFVPSRLTDEQRHRLGQLLMDNPGAFFVPRTAIRRFARRRRRWVIERRFGSALKIRPDADPLEFERQLQGLLDRDPWKALAG